MRRLDPGSRFIDAAEAPILRMSWIEISPGGAPTSLPHGWHHHNLKLRDFRDFEYFLNKITTKAGPTYGLLGQDAGFALPFFLLACYKSWNLGKVSYRGINVLTRRTINHVC